VTVLVDGVREVDVVHLCLIKAFNSVSYNILIYKLTKYGLMSGQCGGLKTSGATGPRDL